MEVSLTMKRALFAMVVGLGFGLMGCATDVEDTVPPAPAPEEQRDPPQQALNAQLRDPQAQLISGIEINRGFESVPAKQKPPIPSFRPPDEQPQH
jgi:hypothetical protein